MGKGDGLMANKKLVDADVQKIAKMFTTSLLPFFAKAQCSNTGMIKISTGDTVSIRICNVSRADEVSTTKSNRRTKVTDN